MPVCESPHSKCSWELPAVGLGKKYLLFIFYQDSSNNYFDGEWRHTLVKKSIQMMKKRQKRYYKEGI